MAMRYFQTANSLAHGANALVHIAAAVMDPTALSTLSGAANGWLALKEALNLETDTLQKLYCDTEGELQERLEKPDFHVGQKDRAALPQMLIDVRPDLSDLVAGDLNADTILSRMSDSLATDRYELKEAFVHWVKPVLDGLLNNKDFHVELTPQINQAILSRLSQQTELLRTIETMVKQLADQDAALKKTAEREGFIRAISAAYLPDAPQDIDQALRDILAALKDAAAADQRGDLPTNLGDAVNHTLQIARNYRRNAQFQNAITEIENRESDLEQQEREMREEFIAKRLILLDEKSLNARLSNNVKLAAECEIDRISLEKGNATPHNIALRAIDLGKHYERHGIGFDGLLAKALLEIALDRAGPEDEPDAILGELANATRRLGERSTSPELLIEAVALLQQHEKMVPRILLAKDWAATQYTLGVALQTLGDRQSGKDAIARLKEAVTAYQNALEVYTQDSAPMDWAATQYTLGIALETLGARQSGKEGVAPLEEAISAYQNALEVWTKDSAPMQWAMTQENMAFVYLVRATFFDGAQEQTKADLEQAMFHVDAALGVYDPADSPHDHETATALRERILSALQEKSA